MGLFSTKHIINVSSTVYNLAGDEALRPEYLKTAVTGAILNSSTSTSLADTLMSSYLQGPGMTLQQFAAWARTGTYDSSVGMTGTGLTLTARVDSTALTALIPIGAWQTVNLQSAVIGVADFTYWVNQYMVTNCPSLVNSAYTTSITATAPYIITITLVDGTVVTFTPTGYDPNPSIPYLYATYILGSGAATGTLVSGIPVILGTSAVWPDTTGWVQDSHTPGSGTDFVDVWERTDYQGWNTTHTATTSLRQVMTLTQTGTTRSYKVDTQQIQVNTWSPTQFLIYARGSGNSALDALFTTSQTAGAYFPYIPMRTNAKFISSTYMADTYTQSKAALKKAINGNYDNVISQIAANSSIGDIDYAYVVFGVSLNVVENACRQYIYTFFEQIMLGQVDGEQSYADWQTAWAAAAVVDATFQAWANAQHDASNPLFGTDPPPQASYPTLPSWGMSVASNNSNVMTFNMSVTCAGMVETVYSGLGKPDATVGELWFTTENPAVYSNIVQDFTIDTITLYWQVTASSYKALTIYNLLHTNLAYGNIPIYIGAAEALNDSSESGFIIPLHEAMFRAMPLVQYTQMSTACCFLVLNCHTVTKKNWYAQGWFKTLLIIVVIIIIIIVTIVTLGTGTAATTVGLLGAAADVGAAAGFVAGSMAATIAGLAINAIAAMVLSEIILVGAKAAFGDKVGSIIGAVAALIAVNVGTSLEAGASLTSSLDGLMSASNILKLTEAVGNGYAGFMQAQTQDTLLKTQSLESTYKTDMTAIQTAYDTLMQGSMSALDPLSLTNFDPGTPVNPVAAIFQVEPPSSFLSRTLLAGSDVADLSFALISNFTDIGLNTSLPT